jgi:hypothetical protein
MPVLTYIKHNKSIVESFQLPALPRKKVPKETNVYREIGPLPLQDIILAQLACPLSYVRFCLGWQ